MYDISFGKGHHAPLSQHCLFFSKGRFALALLLAVIQRHHPKLSIILLLLLMSLVNLPQAYRIGKFHFVNKVGKLTLQVMNVRFLRSARVFQRTQRV